ncbi:hypothetical protein GWK47_047818 [Chionoecetes opilio]|uniref:Uncharacterized protein n=1 Tax=Chionoecetes opilio TaxID=41210 RepID=A0A8J4YG72_CHIOP|nr:hypothetical protein GWK47_047818 [Chionoecetes opilio]
MGAMLGMMTLVDVGVQTAKHLEESHRSSLDEKSNDYMDTQDQPKNMFELIQEHMDYVRIALYIMLVLSLLTVITTSMLIHGVRRDRRGLLLPFMVQEVVNIIIFVAMDVTLLVLFGAQEAILGMVFSVLGGVLLQLYLLVVVISQYQALGLIRMHEEISMK